MARGQWDTDGEGNIIVHPLTGYSTLILKDGTAVIRLEYMLSPDQPFEQPQSLQLVMTRAQAAELGGSVQQMSVAEYKPTPPADPRH